MATAFTNRHRQAEHCEHGDRLDDLENVTRDSAVPLHAMQFITHWTRGKNGRAVHPAAICASSARKFVCAQCKYSARAICVRRQGELHWSSADHTRMRAEFSRSAEKPAIPIELITILDERGSEDVPRRIFGGDRQRAPIPCISR